MRLVKIEILELARNDLIEAHRFYESQEEGLGNYFLDGIFADIDSLKIFGGIHAKPFRNFHRALAKRFPFAIYYRFENWTVFIYAVIDCRRNPTWIRRRLGRT